jgi:hypothetical protein
LRARVAFQVKYRCLHELDLRIPLGYGISVPWFDQEIGSSFTEIFLEQEYARLFEFVKAPTRWIDLGAFAGFFSIWLLWNRRRLLTDDDQCEALLIDADEVRIPYIQDLFRINNLTEKFRFCHGAIGAGKETCKFVHTPWMGSALASLAGTNTNAADVPILTASEIRSIFRPPFELLKVISKEPSTIYSKTTVTCFVAVKISCWSGIRGIPARATYANSRSLPPKPASSRSANYSRLGTSRRARPESSFYAV